MAEREFLLTTDFCWGFINSIKGNALFGRFLGILEHPCIFGQRNSDNICPLKKSTKCKILKLKILNQVN